MTKELETLKELGNYRISDIDYCVKDTNEYDIIETFLKENQDIQSCFEDYGLSIKDIRKICVSYKQREKHEKALKIIKKKGISIWALKIANDAEHYNSIRNIWSYNACTFVQGLTQEEFDLLKEVLL